MADVFISYARSTAAQAAQIAEGLRALGYGVWRDDELPAHRAYADVIEERLQAAKAVLVIWSAEAATSEWVQSEADTARTEHKLVQLTIDGSKLPRPFDRIQCADLAGWSGDTEAGGWKKVVASIADLVGAPAPAASPVAQSAPPPLPSKPSIAVMPFANLSGDPEQAYFADGMVEEITNALSRIKSIFVIGRGSTNALKGKGDTPQEAAAKLGVRYVLEGSVRKAGQRVRIAVKLTDAVGGVQVWADRFEDTLDDVFALQDKVALGVAGVIEPTVQNAELRRVARRPTESMGAYDLYLRALPLALSYADAGTMQALPLLERALAIDPDFGPALAIAGVFYYMRVQFGWSNDPEGDRGRAGDLSRRAVRASPDDAEVLARAATTLVRLDGSEAGTLLIERALALNPGSAFVRRAAGLHHVFRGEPDLAIQDLELAIRIDPLVSGVGANPRMFMGIARFQQGRFTDALPLLQEAARQTNAPGVPAYMVATCGHLRRIGEAQAELARYRAASSTPIEDRALGKSEHRELFMDGIALAEGESPVDH